MEAELFTALVLVVVGVLAIPYNLARGAFGLLWSTHGLRKRWGSVPLETKSHIRLRTATFVFTDADRRARLSSDPVSTIRLRFGARSG